MVFEYIKEFRYTYCEFFLIATFFCSSIVQSVHYNVPYVFSIWLFFEKNSFCIGSLEILKYA